MKRGRYYELEGLRGLTALIVVVYHFFFYFFPFAFLGPNQGAVQNMRLEDNLYGNPIMSLLSGTLSVAIFFVLSGFVLSIGFFHTKDLAVVRKLASKRYLRLMIPALASVLLCFILIKLNLAKIDELVSLNHADVFTGIWNFSPTLFDAIKSGILDTFMSAGNPYNGVLWTMTTEFMGSFMIFGSLMLFGQIKNRWIIYVGLTILTFNTWYLCFVVGMAMADMVANGYISQKKVKMYHLLPLVIVALTIGGYPLREVVNTPYQYLHLDSFSAINWNMLFLTISSAAIIYLVLSTRQLSGLFRNRHLMLLGKYSFSMYLVHIMILYTIGLAIFLFAHRLGLSLSMSALVSLGFSLPIIALVSYLFQKYIDEPSIRFSTFFSKIFLEGEINGKSLKDMVKQNYQFITKRLKARARRNQKVYEEAEL